jgi:two-component system, sensor histidine kinase and response regulator
VSKPGFSKRAAGLLEAPAALPLLVLLFGGGWWLAGVAGPKNLGLATTLAMASAFAAGYLALKHENRRHLRHVRQLAQAEERLQAQVSEHERSFQIAQQAAEENRRTIWKVFKASSDPMAVLDAAPDGIFLAINPAFAALLGYTRDEVLCKTPLQLNLLANPENLADFSRKLEPEGYVPNAETAFRTKDGRIVWGLLSAVTVEVAGNSYVSWIIRDITDRKRMETELIAARKAAETASRAKSEFLSSMSHEIRTPMNAILGMAQLLAETEISADQRHYLDLMAANCNSLLDLINSILDLAKIESGRMQVEHSEFDLIELVDKTVATFAVRAHSKGLELVARVAPMVPERVVGDPLRLRQVLMNLIGNAIKFTDSGEIVLQVDHSALFDGLMEVQFAVADTGIGIPPDKLDWIFGNFTQADSSTTRKYGGSGLGLAIAHRLVGLMGGQLSVESEPDKGSCFRFITRFGQPLSTNHSPVKSTISLAGYRMLVADNSRINRQVVQEMLIDSGAEVDEAANWNNALGLIRQAAAEGRAYQFVLLDMALPSVTGFEVTRCLHNYHLPPKSLLPMLTSDELRPQVARLQQLGLSTYLVKPITRKVLFETIRTLTDEVQRGRLLVPDMCQNAQHMAPRRLLVADDSPDNRVVIAAYLRREPYQIDFTEDGKQAFEKFITNLYDLVLMDIQMPEMDGLDATRAIRQWEFEHGLAPTPIVALTAYALEEDIGRTLSAGCNLHLSKPLRKQALIECIQQAFRMGGATGIERRSQLSPYYS